jgi:dephospho-CoA kinase
VSFGLLDAFLPLYDLVVFVYVPVDVRIERIKKREYDRYGDRVLPGNERYDLSNELIEYAKSYDNSNSGRNLKRHEEWLKTVECPVLRITNICFEDSIRLALNEINR